MTANGLEAPLRARPIHGSVPNRISEVSTVMDIPKNTRIKNIARFAARLVGRLLGKRFPLARLTVPPFLQPPDLEKINGV